jgi:anti-anti-sigma regulatory factor
VKWIEPVERFVQAIMIVWLYDIISKSVSRSSKQLLSRQLTEAPRLGSVELALDIEYLGDVAIVKCKGRIVRSDASLKLRKAVTSQQHARIVVLDLTEVQAIEGGGLGMLWFLQRWAEDHDIHLKLYNPTNSVRHSLEHNNANLQFEIVTLEEMEFFVAHPDNLYAKAA